MSSKQSYFTRAYYAIFPKPLELQLVEACEAVPGLRKRGENEILEFNYLRIVDLAGALRKELLPRGITIIPNDLECIEDILETPEGRFIEARVKTEFIISNGRQTLRLSSYGSARSAEGFAISAAQTFALKGLLKRLSLIFGDEDDPELARRESFPETPHLGKRQREYQKRAWSDAVANSGKSEDEIGALLTQAMGFDVTSEQIASLPPEDFDKAMELLLRNSDMTQVLVAELERRRMV